jgi:hypothetical protein
MVWRIDQLGEKNSSCGRSNLAILERGYRT